MGISVPCILHCSGSVSYLFGRRALMQYARHTTTHMAAAHRQGIKILKIVVFRVPHSILSHPSHEMWNILLCLQSASLCALFIKSTSTLKRPQKPFPLSRNITSYLYLIQYVKKYIYMKIVGCQTKEQV